MTPPLNVFCAMRYSLITLAHSRESINKQKKKNPTFIEVVPPNFY